MLVNTSGSEGALARPTLHPHTESSLADKRPKRSFPHLIPTGGIESLV